MGLVSLVLDTCRAETKFLKTARYLDYHDVSSTKIGNKSYSSTWEIHHPLCRNPRFPKWQPVQSIPFHLQLEATYPLLGSWRFFQSQYSDWWLRCWLPGLTPAPWRPLLVIFKISKPSWLFIQPLICCHEPAVSLIWVLGSYKTIFYLFDAFYLFFKLIYSSIVKRWVKLEICIISQVLCPKIYWRQNPPHSSQWPSKKSTELGFFFSLEFLLW